MCCSHYARDGKNCSCSLCGQGCFFLKGSIEPDPEELDLVFDRSPNYAEVVAQVRIDLNWNEPNDGVELE
jgi:hypothetical protein